MINNEVVKRDLVESEQAREAIKQIRKALKQHDKSKSKPKKDRKVTNDDEHNAL